MKRTLLQTSFDRQLHLHTIWLDGLSDTQPAFV